MIQNIIPTTEWEKNRLGKITSSEISVLFTEPRSKAAKEAGELSEGCKTYLKEKVTELLTGTVRVFDSYATDWGNSMEPKAMEVLKEMYPSLKYYGGNEKWFCEFIGYSGGSPDCASEELKLIGEIKCPENPAFHLDHLLLNTSANLKDWNKEYWYQVQSNMLFVSRKWGIPFDECRGIFGSYHEFFSDKLRLKVIEIEPDLEFADALINKLEAAFQYMRSIRDLVQPLRH